VHVFLFFRVDQWGKGDKKSRPKTAF